MQYDITRQVRDAILFLCETAHMEPTTLLVLGCSTSEILGGHIGKAGSPELGVEVVRGAMEACAMRGVWLAVQCCEHLNRALVLPQQVFVRKGYTPVNVVPHPNAGGSCAAAYFRLLPDPVVVESVQAEAGMDIGNTLIGMHIKPVVVPLRPPVPTIGRANLVMAYARPKYIGGPRARYTLDQMSNQP